MNKVNEEKLTPEKKLIKSSLLKDSEVENVTGGSGSVGEITKNSDEIKIIGDGDGITPR